METGLGLEHAYMGIFTELGTLYARYRSKKLMEHIKLFSTRINIPKLIRVYDEQQYWKELAYLYIQYNEYDNAAATIMNHSPEAWDHMQFKDVAVNVHRSWKESEGTSPLQSRLLLFLLYRCTLGCKKEGNVAE
ncbi:unnamed protein product [Calypogeia fissa]